MASPLMTGVTHSSAQMAPPYPATVNSSIMPQSIATMAETVSYTNAAASDIESDFPTVNPNRPMNRTKQFALDNQSCCFMVQDTLQARFWADYRTLTATFTRATTIIASVTQYIDTIVTNYETVYRLANTTSTYVSQIGRIPPTQTTDCIVPIIPTQLIGLNDSRTEPNKAMYASTIQYKNTTFYGTRSTSIFYVYSTVKIIQVPPVTSANGLFQCTTKSEFLPCHSSITFDSNPYLGSYYLSQPTAATQLPGSLSHNAIESAANASVYVDTILTFPTSFTYLPSVDDRLEGLGYVPRSILDWMLQQDAYTGHASLLTSCSPGGPPLINLDLSISAPIPLGVITVDTLLFSAPTIIGTTISPSSLAIIVDTAISNVGAGVKTIESNVGGAITTAVSNAALPVITDGLGEMPAAGPVVATPGKDLTVSTAITVTSAGCFNPEACPTIRASRALEANSASVDLISQTVKPGRPSTTTAWSKMGDAAGTADKALPLLLTFGGHLFTPYPAGFSIDGTSISAGGRGVTIARTIIQLESSGVVKIGSSVISMKNTAILDDDLQFAAYSVGGQVFTPNRIAFRLAGTTISAEGPGVTIAGTPIRLETSGILKIGTSVASIANIPSTTDNSRLASVGTEILTPNPTASAVLNSAVSEAGSIITVSITPTNLATSADHGAGGSIPTLTPKSPRKASNSGSGRNLDPIVKKRLAILFVMYLIC